MRCCRCGVPSGSRFVGRSPVGVVCGAVCSSSRGDRRSAGRTMMPRARAPLVGMFAQCRRRSSARTASSSDRGWRFSALHLRHSLALPFPPPSPLPRYLCVLSVPCYLRPAFCLADFFAAVSAVAAYYTGNDVLRRQQLRFAATPPCLMCWRCRIVSLLAAGAAAALTSPAASPPPFPSSCPLSVLRMRAGRGSMLCAHICA
jgi:hypothetical protein